MSVSEISDGRRERVNLPVPRTRRSALSAPSSEKGISHRPILSYVPQTAELLNEYCVAFPDETRPYGSHRLPDADDVLAKWLALSADESGLIREANMHLAGRQIDAEAVRGDLARLARWDRVRSTRARAGIVRAA